MRAVVQRVRRAAVEVDGRPVAAMGPGLLALVGAARNDGPKQAAWLAAKLAHLRVFDDAAGKLGRSVLEAGGGILVVPQFTLLGDVREGRRPDFTAAAPPEAARVLVDAVVDNLHLLGIQTSRGIFGAHMVVSLENDGPVTVILDTPASPPA